MQGREIKLTKQEAIEAYKSLFGEKDKSLGYSYSAVELKNGNVLVFLNYSRNTYHSEIEDKVLITTTGIVYRDGNKVGHTQPLTKK